MELRRKNLFSSIRNLIRLIIPLLTSHMKLTLDFYIFTIDYPISVFSKFSVGSQFLFIVANYTNGSLQFILLLIRSKLSIFCTT